MNFENEIRRIASAPRGGDEISGKDFRLRVSIVTDDGIVVHTITTDSGTQTERTTLKEWREAFNLES